MSRKKYSQLPPFGKLIKKHMFETGKTQMDLAKETGLSPQHISYIMNGGCTPQFKTLKKLCNAMGVPTSDVIELLLNESE